jgi:hypothetical protein
LNQYCASGVSKIVLQHNRGQSRSAERTLEATRLALTRRRRSKLFALRNSIGGAHLRGYAVSLGGVLRAKLPVCLLRYPFIVKSSLPAASRCSHALPRGGLIDIRDLGQVFEDEGPLPPTQNRTNPSSLNG